MPFKAKFISRLSFSLLFFFCSGLLFAQQPGNSARVSAAGSACRYNTFKGKCVVTSLGKTEDSTKQARIKGSAGYEGYEVKFRFIPLEAVVTYNDRVLKEGIINKRYFFLLANSWYPGPRYLIRYGIKMGAVFPCELNLVARGTCEPILIRFNTIDTSDYFEGKEGGK